MKCQNCNRIFPENLIHESHDIPCYLFKGENRKERKKIADKHGRKNLCKDCHDEYEYKLLSSFLDYLGEELPKCRDEFVLWMKEISKKDSNLKEELIKIAKKIKSEVENGRR